MVESPQIEEVGRRQAMLLSQCLTASLRMGPVDRIGSQVDNAHSVRGHAEMGDNILAGGVRIGEYHDCPPGGPSYEFRVEPDPDRAPVGGQEKRDEVMNCDQGRDSGMERRSKMGYMGQIGPPTPASHREGDLLEPQLG
jgi:hypothetical protein